MPTSYREKARSGIMQIVMIYVGFSAFWIYASDSLLTNLTSDPVMIKRFSIVKGFGFIMVTALLIYLLLMKYVNELLKSYEDINLKNARLNHALIVANAGFYELNCKTGSAIVSRGYFTMLGYDAEKPELTLEWWEKNLHADDRYSAVKLLNECLSGDRAEYKIAYRLRTKSGGWKWIESTGQVVQYDETDHKPLIMIGMHADIDERKKALEKV
jgi:PAS domain S-box-containing protein